MTTLLLALFVAGAPTVDARMRDAANAIEVVRPQKMTRDEQDALIAIARDEKASVYSRARAIGLVGALPNDAARRLWRDARGWDVLELRVQAAWAEGLSVKGTPAFAPFCAALLRDVEPHLREVGVQLLFVAGDDVSVATAKAHAARESDAVVLQLIRRRLDETVRSPGR